MTAESHFSKFSRSSSAIYHGIIGLIITFLISLFVIRTDISVIAHGIIRSSSEPIQINSPQLARVENHNIHENEYVTKGDTLVWLNMEKYDERILHIRSIIDENKQYINDLKGLTRSRIITPNTQLIKAMYDQYIQKLDELEMNIKFVKNEYERTEKLYKQEVIASVEWMEKKYQLEKNIEAKNNFHKLSINEWQRQITDYAISNKKYQNEIDGLQKDIMNYFILAPGSGYVVGLSGIRQGSYVHIGQNIAGISPDDSLTVETFVQPKDIGYLVPGMSAIYQVEAFNYNQWGFATGNITSFSNEVHIIENHPFFKVRCKINEKHLTLKNGYKGELKKGLTATVRFVITKRTLAQLLFDKTQNWLNPNVKNPN